MTFRRTGTMFVLRLFKGEELVTTLTDFLRKYGITAGTITAIGATDEVTIGYFDVENREYLKETFAEDFEILSVTGNVSMAGVDPFPHLHIMLGDRNYNVRGGHLFSARISVTAEVIINSLDTRIERELDADTGLKLMKL